MNKLSLRIFLTISILVVGFSLSAQHISDYGLMKIPGRSREYSPVRQLIDKLGRPSGYTGTETFLAWPTSGICLRFGGDRKVSGVELFNEGALLGMMAFRSYKGALPYSLHFGMDKAEVIRRLGRPYRSYPESLEYNHLICNALIFFENDKISKITLRAKRCIWGNCVNGTGTMAYLRGDRYEGVWRDGRREGQGFCRFADGRTYRGEWASDQPEGTGKMTWPDGRVREGFWQSGRFIREINPKKRPAFTVLGKHKDSEAIKTFLKAYETGYTVRRVSYDNTLYVFNDRKLSLLFDEHGYLYKIKIFRRGFPSLAAEIGENLPPSPDRGHALSMLGKPLKISRSADSEVYIYAQSNIHFLLGFEKRNGKLRTAEIVTARPSSFLSDSRISGDCADGDCDNGSGRFRCEFGVYEGEFRNGRFHGIGKIAYTDGGIYTGDFRNNLREGKGICTWSDKSRYDGEWFENRKSGFGTLYFSDDSRYEGYWKNNKMHGEGTMFFADGKKFIGEWKNDLRLPGGTFFDRSGNVITTGRGPRRNEKRR